MTEVVLETAAFLDSEHARALGIEKSAVQQIIDRFLRCVFEDLGKAPRLLDGDDLRAVLAELLPSRLGRRDPLAAHVGAVLDAYLASLEERQVVPAIFELRYNLVAGLPELDAAVESGELSHSRTAPSPPIVNRAEKVGRNDPCPCGSGRKFKKCCARLGG